MMILAVGVLAAVGLQASALSATRTAEAVKTLNATARSELDTVRGRILDQAAPVTQTCVGDAAGCSVEIRPCRVDGGGTLDCTLGTVAEPTAHAVIITASDGERDVVLRTVVLR